MAGMNRYSTPARARRSQAWGLGLIQRLRRSLLEFIAVPALIVIGFVALAEGIDWLDNHAGPRRAWGPLRNWLAQYVGDTQSAIGVLSAIAGSLFTVTSITFSILLLAVQQGATVLNSQIVDHYLRRGSNRAWFGFFVGVSLFALITLVQTTHTTAPVLGVMVSTLLGALALFALVVLIYGTIDQMRPATLVDAIVAAALVARERQAPLLAASRPSETVDRESLCLPVLADRSGFLEQIDYTALHRLIDREADLVIAIQPAIGDSVLAGSPLAYISGGDEQVVTAIAGAIRVAEHRAVTSDPGYSLHHLHTIGWTAISTARSDPAVGTIAVHAVRDLVAAWREPAVRAGSEARLLYDDPLPLQLIDTLESLMVTSTESHQHQTLALVLDVLAAGVPSLPSPLRAHGARLGRTAARLAASHMPTRVLLAALARYADICRKEGWPDTAQVLTDAERKLHAGASSALPIDA